MAGHSKWAQIKRKKASTDSKRGKLFSKIVKEVSVAARIGGGNPDGNPRLRTAIEKAKEANMPMENIKRAIQKGTGEIPGALYEEVYYEGYGPGSVAILIEALTDNRNRTVAEIRHIMSKHGGNLGEAGCVSWMFDKKGYLLVNKKTTDEDTLLAISLEAGAEDMKNDPKEENYEVITSTETFPEIKSAIEERGIAISSAEITMIPQNYVSIDTRAWDALMRLIETLEDNDDVQNVHANFDIPDEVLTAVSE